MLITCPSCASEYVIDSALLRPNGRTVRCASCRTAFFAPPENPEPDPAEFVAPEPDTQAQAEVLAYEEVESGAGEGGRDDPPPLAVEARNARSAEPDATKGRAPDGRAGRAGGLAALAGLLVPRRGPPRAAIATLALVLGVGALLAGRESIVAAVPRTAGLYAMIGLEVNLRGVAISEVVSVRVVEGGETFLEVEGVLENVAGRAAPVPSIALSVRDRTQTSLYTWAVEPPRESLEPGERVPFRARLVAPPDEARQVLVTFVPASRATFARTGP